MKKQKIIISSLLLCLLITVFPVSRKPVEAFEITDGDVSVRNFEYFNTGELPTEVELLLDQRLDVWEGIFPYNGIFSVFDTRIQETWGMFGFAILDSEEAMILESEIVGGYYVETDQGVEFALEGDGNFKEVLEKVPTGEDGVSEDARKILYPELFGKYQIDNENNPDKETDALPVTTLSGWQFPWPGTTYWKLNANRGWHGTGGKALDFNPISSGTIDVLSPIDGVVDWTCNAGNNHRAIRFVSSGGYEYSVTHVTTGSIYAGKTYIQGAKIGTVATDTPWNACAKSTGKHIHYGFPAKPFTVDGYTFTATNLGSSTFQYLHSTQRLDIYKHPRMMGRINADTKADIVGFGYSGVVVATNKGGGNYNSPKLKLSNFGYNESAGGWRVNLHPRVLADVNNDNRDDIVGFGHAGVYVSLNNGSGGFKSATKVLNSFGYASSAGGWRVNKHVRTMADVNNDGWADVVGFGKNGVVVAINNKRGGFRSPYLAKANFGYNAGGWRVEKHPRILADIDGKLGDDIVGFGHSGVYVAFSKGNGWFKNPQLLLGAFGYGAGGWRVDKHPRTAGDIDGDGDDDLVGFGSAGVVVAYSKKTSFTSPKLKLSKYGYNAGNWRVFKHPRVVTNINNDSFEDVIGFGNGGVSSASSKGTYFLSPVFRIAAFGYNAGGWR